MKRTGDQAFIKDLNQSIVLNLLRFQGAISRADISRQTGLNKATVSSIIDELISEDYVHEIGHGQSQIGRRPMLLDFNPHVGRVIGLDLGTDYIRVLVLDLCANVLDTFEELLSQPTDADQTMTKMTTMLKTVVASIEPTRLGVLGIGVGVPGLVDAARGMVLNAPNLHWQNVQLKSLLEEELNIPVFVDNEANAGAMGEKFRGVGRDTANLVYVSVGAGIGTGIILNNELIRGEQGITGEFGHMTIEVDGRVCSCGNRGCLEMYASEKALMEQYEHTAGESLPTHEIVERAKAQEPEAIQAVEAVGAYLGIGIATLLNGLNPSLILIGSRMRAVDDVLLASIDPVVKARCFTHPYANFRILPSSLGVNACAIGAASLVLHQHFVGPKAHL